MTDIYSKKKLPWRTYLAGGGLILLTACAHKTSETEPPYLRSSQMAQAPIGSTESGRVPLEVNQISSRQSGFEARQISPSFALGQITIKQLQTYVDRCAPGSTLPTRDLDCSDLSLRIKDVLRSDDDVREALITLDRLGRSGRESIGNDEFDRNSGDLSYLAQGIASGLLEPEPAEPPKEPEIKDLDSILNELGLEQNAGIIIDSSG